MLHAKIDWDKVWDYLNTLSKNDLIDMVIDATSDTDALEFLERHNQSALMHAEAEVSDEQDYADVDHARRARELKS